MEMSHIAITKWAKSIGWRAIMVGRPTKDKDKSPRGRNFTRGFIGDVD